MTFVEIGNVLQIPKSSLHGLLLTMTQGGWLRHDEQNHAFTLGIRALEAGNAYIRSVSFVDRAKPFAAGLRDQLHETVQISVRDGRYNVYISKFDAGQSLALVSEVGRRLPAHATGLGKMLLSSLSEPELDALYYGVELEGFTPNTITDLSALKEHLAVIRARGYSMDHEERTEGLRCIATPIYDHTQRQIAAISVSAPIFRFNGREDEALSALKDVSARLSTELGYMPGSSSRR